MKELATGYGLVEGPVWHDALGLLYSDVPNGGVYRIGPSASRYRNGAASAAWRCTQTAA